MKMKALLCAGLFSGVCLLPLFSTGAQEVGDFSQSREFGTGADKAIVESPDDQLVELGKAAVFTAGGKREDVGYQWMRRQRDDWEVLPEQTGNLLQISSVTLADVGHYQCIVRKGNKVQMTRPAALLVQTPSSPSGGGFTALSGGTPITVYSPPVATSGSSGTCPGAYVGYVNFTKAGWGWVPTAGTTVHIAQDLNQTNTTVFYKGLSNDTGCAPSSVTVPNPTVSTKYRFTIYFHNSVPSTNAYPITLTGFDP